MQEENKQTLSLFRAVIPVVPAWAENTENPEHKQRGHRTSRIISMLKLHSARFRGCSESLSARQRLHKLLVALSRHWKHPSLHLQVALKEIPEGLSHSLCTSVCGNAACSQWPALTEPPGTLTVPAIQVTLAAPCSCTNTCKQNLSAPHQSLLVPNFF